LIHVTDNGVGIPEHMQSKLFSHSTKDESGTGLGLWVSRSIVEKHGGTIHVSSSITGPGTTVSVFLPLEAGSRITPADAASAAHGDGG
jgi:signal transduction histidine kinase